MIAIEEKGDLLEVAVYGELTLGDYRRLEADALAGGRPIPALVFTTNRQFPRGHPATTGSLVRSLDYLLSHPPTIPGALFLRPAGGED